MKALSWTGLSLMLLCFCVSPAGATIIFDNGAPDLEGAFFSDADGYGQQCAENFFGYTGSDEVATITGIEWFGVYYGNTPPPEDVFTVSFYSQEAGSRPAISSFRNVAAGSANRVDTGVDFIAGGGTSTHDVYSYSVNFSPLSLNMGQTYYVSITNSSPTASSSDDWLWSSSNNVGGRFWYRYGYDMWSTNSDHPFDLAFNLTGTIQSNGGVMPEPASVTLMAFGLVGLAVHRLRRRG
ncbi:MAG: hypothetical protein WC655_04375 [Candidatus Hydrogenedentales bacterium]|jgi:hypothetical protein